MSNNKYYTPSIEEFHVGFEHERMNGDRWEKDVLVAGDMYGTIAKGYENEFEEIDKGMRDVRVKYLDQEDVESLGFKLLKNYSVEQEYQSRITDDSWYELNVDDKEEYPCLVSIECWVNITKSTSNRDVMFTGTIKNKSELKKLLKQLGIDEKENI